MCFGFVSLNASSHLFFRLFLSPSSHHVLELTTACRVPQHVSRDDADLEAPLVGFRGYQICPSLKDCTYILFYVYSRLNELSVKLKVEETWAPFFSQKRRMRDGQEARSQQIYASLRLSELSIKE